MDILTAYQNFWKRGLKFYGLSTREEYWWSQLANFLVGFLLAFIESGFYQSSDSLPLTKLYLIVCIIPNLSITVRRLRDSGRNWPWIFINFVPLIGGIILIILLAQPSKFFT